MLDLILTPDAARLERMGLTTCKPNCGCQGPYDVKACRDYDRGVRLVQNVMQPELEPGSE